MQRGPAVLVALAILVGCGDGEAVEPTCGSYADGDAKDAEEIAAIQSCLLEAFEAGEPATMRFEGMSVEGDVNPDIYEVVGVRKVKVTSDYGSDPYRSVDEWVRTCTVLAVEEGSMQSTDCDPPAEPVDD